MPISAVYGEHSVIERARRIRRNPVAAYGTAVALVVMATLDRASLTEELIEGTPYLIFYPAMLTPSEETVDPLR